MTATELAEEVWSCLPSDVRKRMQRKDVNTIVKLIFETVLQEIVLGGSVRIRNFGTITAEFIKGGNMVMCGFAGKEYPRKPNIKLKLIPSPRLRQMVGRIRDTLRNEARKRREESNGEVRVPTGGKGREGEGGGGEGQVSKVREPSEW